MRRYVQEQEEGPSQSKTCALTILWADGFSLIPLRSQSDGLIVETCSEDALACLRGYKLLHQRHLQGALNQFLDSIVARQLEVQESSLTSHVPAEPLADDTEAAAEDPDLVVLQKEEQCLVEKWCDVYQRLHCRARSAQTIIYESQGVTDAYLEGGEILGQIERTVKHLNEICWHTMTCSLEEEWRGRKLTYQRTGIA